MSQYRPYASFEMSSDSLVFRFTSIYPKGDNRKIFQFTRTTAKDVYNLSFGNSLVDGRIDDHTTNANKYRGKILATVATVVYDFAKRFPDRYIFFTGSSAKRTRLYRVALTINYYELSTIINIWGLSKGRFQPFQKRRSYNGFLIKRN